MEIKKGDILLCKKDFINDYYDSFGNSSSSYSTDFNAGKYYTVSIVWESGNPDLLVENNYRENTAFIIKPYWITHPLLWDYFYTKEELRKLKLDRINEI